MLETKDYLTVVTTKPVPMSLVLPSTKESHEQVIPAKPDHASPEAPLPPRGAIE